MEFLRQEVMNEERIALARTGFGLDSNNKRSKSTKHSDDEDYPTAAGLFSGKMVVPFVAWTIIRLLNVSRQNG